MIIKNISLIDTHEWLSDKAEIIKHFEVTLKVDDKELKKLMEETKFL